MTALIPLSGKHAVGPHAFALVDDGMVAFLSQWRWKAKWNAARTHIYAVRNVRGSDGVWRLVRMHRLVLGLADGHPFDGEHRNGNTLDNTRGNLWAACRSANIAKARTAVVDGVCARCAAAFSRTVHSAAAHNVRFCAGCAGPSRAQRRARRLRGRSGPSPGLV